MTIYSGQLEPKGRAVKAALPGNGSPTFFSVCRVPCAVPGILATVTHLLLTANLLIATE